MIGGIAVGLAVGFVIRQVRRRIDHSPTEIAIALLSGYFAYLPAEALDVSAVLAAVTVGLYMGWYTPELTNARTRLQGDAFWGIVTFVLNATLFTSSGSSCARSSRGLEPLHRRPRSLGRAVSLTVIATRAAWSWMAATLQWRIIPLIRDPARTPTNSALAVLTWSGMRGAITLAAALALPLTTDDGSPFPQRNLIVFLAFTVIVVTLVVQGLTLPALVRAVDLPTDPRDAQEEALRGCAAAEAGLARLEELHAEPWVDPGVVERLRDTFELRLAQYSARREGEKDVKLEKHVRASRHLRRELLDAERAALVELRRSGEISDAVERRVRRRARLRGRAGWAAARRARPRPARARRPGRPARPARPW